MRINDRQNIEDVTQDIVLAMFKGIGALRAPEAFHVWMQRIISGICANHRNRVKKFSFERLDDDNSEALNALEFEGRVALPEEAAEIKEDAAILREIIETLPRKRLETVMMYYYEGMSYAEIAEATGVTVGTVSSNMTKAKNEIREKFSARQVAAMPPIADILQGGIDAMFPMSELASFTRKCDFKLREAHLRKAIRRLYHHAASKVAGTFVCTVVSISIILFAFRQSPIPSDAATPGEDDAYHPTYGNVTIEFDGRECACGHVNPRSAFIAGADDPAVTQDAHWTILRMSDGAVLAEGEGSADAQLVALHEQALTDRAPGERYELVFDYSDAVGRHFTVRRAFVIDPGAMIPGLYG
jgi:RNA polymerase sigma-70 factor (ECF subfamily)